MRVYFVAFAVALLGVVGASSLSRTYLPPQVQVQQPHVISVPRVKQQIIHRPVVQPQNTYLPPAHRVVPQVIHRSAPQLLTIARPVPVSVPRNTYLPPSQVISRPVPQVISVAAPRNTYLPPRNTYLPPQ
ncbi:uncharacterized protein LOC128259345 [Drosophila gunungcola]|uniref:Uncharacterized protein n=1 Tax=Drosophila gunungcola TaxID=103775 RepID=A0A9Q0BRI7_9MUSC|nr:uncharacterized protein LOC128257981 [Drosophila gunungcola]XP_052847620.1 uncharacterized protein LOC128259345 [Drosophila gunungcola]KAI8039118.1 hypothetical protein M5D96_007835 [Drosophila gunungcola]KAI8041541.1 hypothetical protein M5D96_005806 [Drosophila gunungcola]